VADTHTDARRSPGSTARRLAVALGLALCLAPPAAAGAPDALEQLGLAGSSASVAPSCPGAPCEVVTATTGFQAAVAGQHNTMVVQRPGRVTGWSIKLAALTPDQVAYFTKAVHGPARAGLVVLHQGAAYRFRVTAAGPLVTLTPYFGRTMSFALAQPLPVRPGDVVGLAVPTWAPALAVALDPATGWRASRARGACADIFRPTTQLAAGSLTKYECVYRTARLTYGATVADDPAPPKSPATSRKPERAPKRSLRRR
jgi:hypothetical protein